MKKFFKDFWNLQAANCRFLKEHWLGNILLCAVMGMAEVFLISARYGVWLYDWMETFWYKLTGVFTKA